MDFVDLRLYPKNTPPRACNANSLKNWQRVIACLAVQEIYERKSMTNAQKYEACYASYIRYAKNIAEKFKDNLHEHFKLEVLQRATLMEQLHLLASKSGIFGIVQIEIFQTSIFLNG
jgi:hypothetical protein